MKKKKEERIKQLEDGKEKVAGVIMGWILKLQHGFANFMSQRTNRLSSFTMKLGLFLFLLMGSSLSIYLLLEAILQKEKTAAIHIDRIKVPVYADTPAEDIPGLVITKEMYEEMKSFQQYMDSLRQSKAGARIFDSILLIRPGLMDSVKKLEQIYLQQNKK